MARTTRCKMKVNRIELQAVQLPVLEEDGKTQVRTEEGDPVWKKHAQPRVVLNPVYAPNASDAENHKFWTASPSGECWLAINNPEGAEVFEIGEEYYVDFTKAA